VRAKVCAATGEKYDASTLSIKESIEGGIMARILYNGHLIVSYPILDEATRTWIFEIQVTLTSDKTESFKTKAQAERAGLNAAKSMIDSLTLEGLG
jgi:hypothetical protein